MDVNKLTIDELKYFAKKYLDTLSSARKQQKEYALTETGRTNRNKRGRRFYYVSNNIYHPEFNNKAGSVEGKKFKREI